MEIYYYKEPFEHLIFKNFFNKSQLKDVWNELNFYIKNGLIIAKEDEQSKLGTSVANKIPKAKREGLFLHDALCNFRLTSKIYAHLAANFFKNEEIKRMCKSTLVSYIKHTNSDSVLISLYKNKHFYKPHTDLGIGTLIVYLWEGKKTFAGGDLYFNDFNYKFNCEYNSAILFPSCHTHEVDEIISTKASPYPYKRISISLFSYIND